MRLVTPQNCVGDQVVYWAPAYSVVSLVPDWNHHLKANVQLNGHDVVAMFDTGATNTIVTSEVAKRPGLRPIVEAATGRQGHGLAAGTYDLDTAVFPSITIGQETIQNPKLLVADIFRKDREAKPGSAIASKPEWEPEMLIGADFFRAHRVYVARGQAKMYFTYLGGPVFQNIRQPAAPAPATASPAAETPGATAGAPTVPPDQAPPQAAPPPGDTPNPATPK